MALTDTGKRKTLSMGVYPQVALKDAQEGSRFEVVAREWFGKFSPGWAPGHAEKIIRRLERDLFPWLGERPVRDINAPELLAARERARKAEADAKALIAAWDGKGVHPDAGTIRWEAAGVARAAERRTKGVRQAEKRLAATERTCEQLTWLATDPAMEKVWTTLRSFRLTAPDPPAAPSADPSPVLTIKGSDGRTLAAYSPSDGAFPPADPEVDAGRVARVVIEAAWLAVGNYDPVRKRAREAAELTEKIAAVADRLADLLGGAFGGGELMPRECFSVWALLEVAQSDAPDWLAAKGALAPEASVATPLRASRGPATL